MCLTYTKLLRIFTSSYNVFLQIFSLFEVVLNFVIAIAFCSILMSMGS